MTATMTQAQVAREQRLAQRNLQEGLFNDLLDLAKFPKVRSVVEALDDRQRKVLGQALYYVYSEIKYDLPHDLTRREKMETVLDADRIASVSQEADDIVDALIAEFGYQRVERDLAAHFLF